MISTGMTSKNLRQIRRFLPMMWFVIGGCTQPEDATGVVVTIDATNISNFGGIESLFVTTSKGDGTPRPINGGAIAVPNTDSLTSVTLGIQLPAGTFTIRITGLDNKATTVADGQSEPFTVTKGVVSAVDVSLHAGTEPMGGNGGMGDNAGGSAGTIGTGGTGSGGGNVNAGGAGGTAGTGGSAGSNVAETCGFVMSNPASGEFPNPVSYNIETPGVIIDNVTHLMWENGTTARAIKSNYNAQLTCDELATAGFGDWRLPSRIELVSLLDFTKFHPTIDSVFPANTGTLWSSTPMERDKNLRWTVGFSEGLTGTTHAGNALSWLCVRNTRPPTCTAKRFVVSEVGWVNDVLTKLTWRLAIDTGKTWIEGDKICTSIVPSARLPTVKELQTIIDDKAMNPLADPIFGLDGSVNEFWTSPGGASVQPLTVTFATGHTGPRSQDKTFAVRCVR